MFQDYSQVTLPEPTFCPRDDVYLNHRVGVSCRPLPPVTHSCFKKVLGTEGPRVFLTPPLTELLTSCPRLLQVTKSNQCV